MVTYSATSDLIQDFHLAEHQRIRHQGNRGNRGNRGNNKGNKGNKPALMQAAWYALASDTGYHMALVLST